MVGYIVDSFIDINKDFKEKEENEMIRFLLRYDLPLFVILFLVAFVLGLSFENLLFFLLFLALAVFVMVVIIVSWEKYRWICRECGHKSFIGKSCTRCRGLMELRKII